MGDPVQLELDLGAALMAVPGKSANDYQEGGDHYRVLAVQPWDALKAWLTPDEYRGYMKGTVIAYIARERSKGGDLDLRKARHYLEKLLEEDASPGC